MGIWGNPAATKKMFYSSWGVHLHPVHPRLRHWRTQLVRVFDALSTLTLAAVKMGFQNS